MRLKKVPEFGGSILIFFLCRPLRHKAQFGLIWFGFVSYLSCIIGGGLYKLVIDS